MKIKSHINALCNIYNICTDIEWDSTESTKDAVIRLKGNLIVFYVTGTTAVLVMHIRKFTRNTFSASTHSFCLFSNINVGYPNMLNNDIREIHSSCLLNFYPFLKRRKKRHMGFPKKPGTARLWTALTGARSIDWCVRGLLMTNTSLRTNVYICTHYFMAYHKTGGFYDSVTNTQFHDGLIFIHGCFSCHHVMSKSGVMSLANFISYLWLAKAKY